MYRFATLRLLLAAVAFAVGLAGCAKPVTTIETVDTRPEIAIANPAATDTLRVNGVVIGPAAAYDGKQATLRLAKGTHQIEILDGDRVVYSETVFLADDVRRTITIR